MRGWDFKVVSDVVAKSYGILLNRPSSFQRKMAEKCILGEQILLHIWGLQAAHLSITTLIRKLDLPIPQPLTEYTGNSIFINAAVAIFSESNPLESKKAKGEPLGLLATNWVMMATSQEEALSEILLEVPLLHAYGSIEQTYLDLLKKGREIDTIGKGE